MRKMCVCFLKYPTKWQVTSSNSKIDSPFRKKEGDIWAPGQYKPTNTMKKEKKKERKEKNTAN